MKRTALYRHYDADGVLLYVGISANPDRRGWEHKCRAEWACEIARSDVTWFPTKSKAKAAEVKAIRKEQPRHNQRAGADASLPVTGLIDSWPTRREFAVAVGAPLASVHKWAKNDRIPVGWQAAVVRAAQDAGHAHITPGWMLQVHAMQRGAA